MSAKSLFWTLVLMTLMMYTFALLGLNITDPYYAQYKSIGWEKYVGGLGEFMLTMVQFMTLDSWTSVMRPMIEVQGGGVAAFFLIYIAIMARLGKN